MDNKYRAIRGFLKFWHTLGKPGQDGSSPGNNTVKDASLPRLCHGTISTSSNSMTRIHPPTTYQPPPSNKASAAGLTFNSEITIHPSFPLSTLYQRPFDNDRQQTKQCAWTSADPWERFSIELPSTTQHIMHNVHYTPPPSMFFWEQYLRQFFKRRMHVINLIFLSLLQFFPFMKHGLSFSHPILLKVDDTEFHSIRFDSVRRRY